MLFRFNRKLAAMVISTLGITSVSSIALVAPAHAAALDFSGVSIIGTGTVGAPGNATLTTAGGAEALPGNTLQSFLGVANESLDLSVLDQAFEGSAFKIAVNAGDQFSFNWTSVLEQDNPDYAFTVFNGVITQLSASGFFNQTFASAGLFSIGIVDIGDSTGDSTLTLSNANFTPIPTPALLPGLIGMGVAALRKRQQADQG